MFRIKVLLPALLFSANAFAAESWPGMPMLAPKKVFTVPTSQAGEELQANWGFGEKSPEVNMMNLMMVGGSGYEGMDMAEAAKAPAPAKGHAQEHAEASEQARSAPAYKLRLIRGNPVVGKPILEISVTDANGRPARGLKLRASIFMTTMDMGTTNAEMKETAPGAYSVRAPFSMAGEWAIKVTFPQGFEEILPVSVIKK